MFSRIRFPLPALLMLPLLLLVSHIAYADTNVTAAPPFDWSSALALCAVVLGGIGTMLGGVSVVLHAIAPRTKTTLDDRAAAGIDSLHAKIAAFEKNIQGMAAAIAPQTSKPGFVAMPLLAALAIAGCLGLALGGCATTGATVKTEVTTLEGCSAADASAIVTASAAIVADVKAPDHVTAAIDVIGQLAVIHSAWSRCKGAAPPTIPAAVPAAVAPTKTAVSERELLFCGTGCMADSQCSEGTSCSKCVDNTCTTEAPLAPEPERVATSEAVRR